jgi:hypothetical protein
VTAGLEEIKATGKASQEKMEANQEGLQAKMEASLKKAKTVAQHYNWVPATHRLSRCCRAGLLTFYMSHNEVTYKNTTGALTCFLDQYLVYCTQLKTRNKPTGKPLLEFATSIELSTHSAFPALQEPHVHSDSGKVFVNSIKWQLLLGGKRMANKTLESKGKKLATGSPIRVHKTSDRVFWSSLLPLPPKTEQETTNSLQTGALRTPTTPESSAPHTRRSIGPRMTWRYHLRG